MFRHNMPAPIGNKNALGNRGGGRKSAYDEIKEAEWLAEAWNCDQDVETLRKKIEEEKIHSVKDILLWKALNGNVSALKRFADAILPSKVEMRSENTPISTQEVEEKISHLIRLEEEAKCYNSTEINVLV